MTPKRVMSGRKRAFVRALVQGKTLAETAGLIGVSVRTVARYHADPVVRRALRDAQDVALDAVMRRMSAGCDDALDVLRSIMMDGTMPGGVRLRASRIWLETAFRSRELMELTGRVAELERQAKAKR